MRYSNAMSQREAWEAVAAEWAEFVRRGTDTPYTWNSGAFLGLLPAPGRLTVDVGCGEGRLARQLAAHGYRVVAFDVSPTMVRLASEADPQGDYRVADAAALPLVDGEADLVVAFMSLQDVDDVGSAIREAARVLEPRGRMCLAVLHPVFSAGEIQGEEPDAPFVIAGSYLDAFREDSPMIGVSFTVTTFHRPLETYFRALEDAGFLVEAARELPTRRRAPGRIPLFLHVRAVKS
jgi:ubiquinone/menaquinone biosynthesis C-methylase UbiE